jgi:hypothetical protein
MPLHCRGGLIRDIGDNPSPAGEDEKQFRRSTKHILRAYPGLQLEKSKSPRANNNSTQEAAAKNKTGRVLIPLAAVMHRRMAQPSLCPAPALDSILYMYTAAWNRDYLACAQQQQHGTQPSIRRNLQQTNWRCGLRFVVQSHEWTPTAVEHGTNSQRNAATWKLCAD